MVRTGWSNTCMKTFTVYNVASTLSDVFVGACLWLASRTISEGWGPRT